MPAFLRELTPRRLLLSTAVSLAAAVAVVLLLTGSDGDGASTDDELTREPIDDVAALSFTEFDGTENTLGSLRGSPVVLNFFASTCVPCITEMPAFEDVHTTLGDEVTFFGLAVQDRPDEALALVDRTGVTYRTAQDRDGSVFAGLGAVVLPTTVLLDADGEVVATHTGALTAAELTELVADELGVASPST